jgi:hypothetical protein
VDHQLDGVLGGGSRADPVVPVILPSECEPTPLSLVLRVREHIEDQLDQPLHGRACPLVEFRQMRGDDLLWLADVRGLYAVPARLPCKRESAPASATKESVYGLSALLGGAHEEHELQGGPSIVGAERCLRGHRCRWRHCWPRWVVAERRASAGLRFGALSRAAGSLSCFEGTRAGVRWVLRGSDGAPALEREVEGREQHERE